MPNLFPPPLTQTTEADYSSGPDLNEIEKLLIDYQVIPKAKGVIHGGYEAIKAGFQAPAYYANMASEKLTGNPLAINIKAGMEQDPLNRMLMESGGKISPTYAAMQDEAEKAASELGADPMTIVSMSSKLIAAMFSGQAIHGAGESAGAGLYEYEKNGFTPEAARHLVRTVAMGLGGGVGAKHALRGVKSSPNIPMPSIPKGVKEFASSLKPNVVMKSGQPKPPPTYQEIRDKGQPPSEDRWLTDEELNTPSPEETARIAASDKVASDAFWARREKPSSDVQMNMGLDPKQLKDAFLSVLGRAKFAPVTKSGKSKPLAFDTKDAANLATQVGMPPPNAAPIRGEVFGEPKVTPTGKSQIGTPPPSEPVAPDLMQKLEEMWKPKLPGKGQIKMMAQGAGVSVEEMTKQIQAEIDAIPSPPIDTLMAQYKEKQKVELYLKAGLNRNGGIPESAGGAERTRLEVIQKKIWADEDAASSSGGSKDLLTLQEAKKKALLGGKKPGASADMLGLQQTWEKGKDLIESLRDKGKISPTRQPGDDSIGIPPPSAPSKVPLVKSPGYSVWDTEDLKANPHARKDLMDTPLSNKWNEVGGYQEPLDFAHDPEVAPYMEHFKEIDDMVQNHSGHMVQSYTGKSTPHRDKFSNAVASVPSSAWRTRANQDHEWYYNRVNALADEWKSSSTSEGATLLKEAIKRITGDNTPVYNPSGHKVSEEALKIYQPIVHRMYRDTQEALREPFEMNVNRRDIENVGLSEEDLAKSNSLNASPEYIQGYQESLLSDKENDLEGPSHGLKHGKQAGVPVLVGPEQTALRLYRGIEVNDPKGDIGYYEKDLQDHRQFYRDTLLETTSSPTKKQEKLESVKASAKMIQDKLDQLHLRPTVESNIKTTRGNLESWSSYSPVTKGFGATILVDDVAKDRILTFYRAPSWRQKQGGIGEGEYEFLVMNKSPKASRIGKQDRKALVSADPRLGKSVVGTPPDKTVEYYKGYKIYKNPDGLYSSELAPEQYYTTLEGAKKKINKINFNSTSVGTPPPSAPTNSSKKSKLTIAWTNPDGAELTVQGQYAGSILKGGSGKWELIDENGNNLKYFTDKDEAMNYLYEQHPGDWGKELKTVDDEGGTDWEPEEPPTAPPATKIIPLAKPKINPNSNVKWTKNKNTKGLTFEINGGYVGHIKPMNPAGMVEVAIPNHGSVFFDDIFKAVKHVEDMYMP